MAGIINPVKLGVFSLIFSLAIVLLPDIGQAQEKTALIMEYNDLLLAKDFQKALETLKSLIASEPANFDYRREEIKLLGALNEEQRFLEAMIELRKEGHPVAIQNFYDILDFEPIPETFKETLKRHFEEANDSFILKEWEREARNRPIVLTGSPDEQSGDSPSAGKHDHDPEYKTDHPPRSNNGATAAEPESYRVAPEDD